MTYRNKTYVCFDADNDMRYFSLMKAWKGAKNTTFNFHNAHDLNNARDTSLEESIKRQLRIRLKNSKLFIVLIGNRTKFHTKFVKWEMEFALRLDLPIIGANLNGSRKITSLCPPAIRDELAVFVPFNQKIIEFAMNDWPDQHDELKEQEVKGARYYRENVYERLGL